MNDFVCKKCGAKHNYTLKEVQVGSGIATGQYCQNCGQWAKWLGKKDLKEAIQEAVQYKKLPKESEPSPEEKTIDERIEELKKTIEALKDLKARFQAVRGKKVQEEENKEDFVPDLDDLPPWDE